jgi:hypothetical protein
MSQEINLLPRRVSRKTFRATSADGLALGVLAAAVLAIALAVYENHQLRGVQREAQHIERALKDVRAAHEKAVAERAARKPADAPDAKLAELEVQLQGRQQVLDTLKSGAVGTTAGFSQYMLALSRQTLPGVWLTAFDFADGATALTLTGRALSPELLPTYLQRLTQETPLQGRRFASMVISQPRGAGAAAPVAAPYIEFEISSEPAPRSAQALPAPSIAVKADPPAAPASPAQAAKAEASK